MTEYMDPNRPKLITPPPAVNPEAEHYHPGSPFGGTNPGPSTFEQGQGNYSDRKDRSVPLPR